MDRLGVIEVFVTIVDAGSISRAAERLDMGKSAVSRRLSSLEARLGVQLLNRTTRRLNLTDELFGIVGGFILYSVIAPQHQVVAMVMAAISMVGYLGLMWSVGGYNSSIFKVAIVDMVGIGFLVTAAVLKYKQRR